MEITIKQFDKSTPDKFKEEFPGIRMGFLNSKTYIIWKAPNEGVIKFKCSSKGFKISRIL